MKRVGFTILATVLVAAVIGCGGSSQSSSTGGDTGNGSSLTTVKVGDGPYLDYVGWGLADKLGFAKEFGLKLDFTEFASPNDAVKQIARGGMDVAYDSHPAVVPILAQTPQLRNWMITDQFEGFRIIGRKGEAVTYDDLEKKVGKEEAVKQVLESWKGKKFVIVGALFKGLVDGALQQIGSSIKDVQVVDFANDAQAAQAFIGGTGDYYTGSLPQTTKMLFEHGDKFVSSGGTDVLGPGGLWFSTMVTSDGYVAEHQDTLVRMLATWYRAMKYLKEQPDKAIPMIRDQLNKSAAAAFTDDQIKFLVSNLVDLMTYEQAKDITFNPASDRYWRISLDHYVKVNQGTLPDGFQADKYFLDEQLFKKLEARKDLVAKINKPFAE